MINTFSEGLLLAMAMPGGAGGAEQGSPLQFPIMLFIMLAIFWVLLIRPQQRREKERKAMLEAVKSGDKVVFSGGILGVVTNVKDKTVMVKIADNVKVEVTKGAVSQILEKGEKPEPEA